MQARRLVPLIGIVPLALILRSVDFDRAYQVVATANTALILLSLCLVPAEAVIKSFKMQVLASTHQRCRFGAALRVYLTGIFYGAISPGKVGDFVKVYTLSRKVGLRLIPSLAVVLIERLIETACLMLLTVSGLVALSRIEGIDPILVAWGASLAALAAVSALLLGPRIAKRGIRSIYRLLISRLGWPGIESCFDVFREAVSKTCGQRQRLGIAFFLGLLGWVVILLRPYVIATGLGINIDLYAFALLYPIVIVVELLPISILGLGTREYATALLLARFGVGLEHAVVLSLLVFVLSVVPIVLAGYLAVAITAIEGRMPRSAKIEQDRGSDEETLVESVAGKLAE